MVSDEDRWFHRLRGDLCRLGDIAREYENENHGERQAFNPFPECSFLMDGRRLEDGELINAYVGAFKDDEIFNGDVRNLPARNLGSRTFDHEDNFSFTIWLTRDPSALFPARRARAAFITFPISFIEAAPVSCTASSIALRISSSEAAAGRYSSIILISASSFWANSSRAPLRNCSTESFRCLTSVLRTATTSFSSSGFIFSISLFLTAVFIMRNTLSRN